MIPIATDLAKWRTYQAQTNITLKEGLNQVYVWCKNADNVPTTYKYTEITLDSIAPTRDAPSFAMNGFQILATCNQRDETSEELTVQYGYKKVDDTEYTWQDSQIIVNVDPGARYMIATRATDMAGNTSESRSVMTDEILSIPDVRSLTATPATGWTRSVTVHIEYPDTHNVTPYVNLYRIDGGDWEEAKSNNVTMKIIKNCKIEAVVAVRFEQDLKLGNIKSLSIKNIDRVDPYIHDVEYATGYVQEGYDVKAKVYDKESGLVAWTVTNDKVTPTSWNHEFAKTTNTVDITYRIDRNGVYYIWAKDEGGNLGYIGIEVTNIDLYDPIINSLTVSYGVGEATLTAKAIDSELGLAAYAFVKGQNAEPSASDWKTIEKTITEYTMTGSVTANDYYTIWVKDVSGRTAKQGTDVKVKYKVTYIWYDIDNTGAETTRHVEEVWVDCNSNLDLSKKVTRDYSNHLGWNRDPNAKNGEKSPLEVKDPTQGQEDITLYGIFEYVDTISFSSSNTATTYELNLTISKTTPFTTLQYSKDNKTWTNYSSPLYITSNGTIYARTMYKGEVVESDDYPISNICVNHNWSSATCTKESRCTLCNKYNGPALGHDLGDDWYVTVAATCTTSGTERNDCIRYNACGKYDTRTVAAYGHSYGAYVTTTVATCTSNGVQTSTCANCGDKQTKTIDKLGHSYGSYVVTTAATCTSDGVQTSTCANCGDKQTKTIDKLGHSYVGYQTKAANCVTAQEGYSKCSVCDYSYSWIGSTDSSVHAGPFSGKRVSYPTCTAKGKVSYTCDSCNNWAYDETDGPNGHTWGAYVVTKAKTCTTDGSKTRTCSVCNATQSASIPASHNYGDPEIVNGTCIEAGYHKYTCKDCGVWYTVEGSYGSHSYGSWYDYTNTQHQRKCSRCGATQSEAHSYGTVHNIPVCTKCGFQNLG